MDSKINTPLYGVVDRGIFGLRIIYGIVIGVQYTSNKPKYCIASDNSSVWTDNVSDSPEGLIELLNIPTPTEIVNKTKLDINFNLNT